MLQSLNNKNRLLLDYRLVREGREDLTFNVDLALTIGEGIVGILGDSGTGKSTLLKALAGLMNGANYQFSVHDNSENLHTYYCGIDMGFATDSNRHRISSAAPNPFIYLGAESILFEHLSVAGNLALVQKQGAFAQNAKLSLNEVVDLCGIADLLQQKPSALSSGENQRVKFARALLSGKQCILLDEAFSALDWRTRQYFANLVVTLHHDYGFCFLMVSHSLRELAISCTHLIHLHNGQVARFEALDNMLDYFQHTSAHKSNTNNTPLAMKSHFEADLGDVFSLLEIKVKSHDQQAKLLECVLLDTQNESNSLVVRSRYGLTLNSMHKLTIDADKVSLATSITNNTSMLNCLLGEVVTIDRQDSLVIVTLLIGNQKLRSAISIRSFEQLSIKHGDSLYALFKAL
jgi:molybdate transport system ATP-binding protein